MLLKTFKQLFNKQKIKSSAWDAAGSGRRFFHFQPELGSINNLLSQNLETLRSRSRDMVRKNPYAANIIDTIVSNSIGTGIKPQSKARDGEFRKKVQELWLKWTDEADSCGMSDFYGLQALVCRSMIEGGECFVRLRNRKLEDGFSVPLQLQVLESEHLDNKTNQTLGNGNIIRNGIEFNRLGQREAYYLFREHPGEGSFGESVRVPANDVLHIYKPLRPGQIRGEPWLSSILLKLYELDQYDDAELVRKKTAAMFAGFITSAPREAFRRQLVKIQPRQSLANSLEQTIILHKVTSVVKLMEWTIQGTTKVKVLSPEMPDVIEVDIFRIMEDSMKDNDKASYHSLYRDPRPCHVLRWILNELGRSFVFLLRYVETSQQRRGLMEDTKEVGLIGSTQSVGKPHTRGSGQQYSNWNRDCNTDTTEIGGICKEN